MGFCLFNSIAVAARHALDAHALQRVLILDWDVHHGNGTNDIFRASPEVLYVSIHQSPLYPGTGALADSGTGDGEGYTINLPVPPGSGHDEWLSLVQNLVTVIDAINRARPTGVKGDYVRSIYLTSTQGPSVKLDRSATLSIGGRTAARIPVGLANRVDPSPVHAVRPDRVAVGLTDAHADGVPVDLRKVEARATRPEEDRVRKRRVVVDVRKARERRGELATDLVPKLVHVGVRRSVAALVLCLRVDDEAVRALVDGLGATLRFDFGM